MIQEPGGSTANDSGFTLIELLIAIVVVGVLTAIAIVGVSGLTTNGKASACQATMDAAKAASSAYFANTGSSYPQTFTVLTAPATGQQLLVPAHGVTVGSTTISGKGWTLNLVPGATPADPVHFTGC